MSTNSTNHSTELPDFRELLKFEDELGLQDVKVLESIYLRDTATWYKLELTYADQVMIVPFIHYDGENWLFTPWDWQGTLPQTPDELESIKWRVNNTDSEGIILNVGGVPRIF